MSVYQDKAKQRIKGSLRRINTLIAKGKIEKFKEADTRKIVTEVLTKCLGWDDFENLTAEQMIGSRYADFVIKSGDEELAVIEVKSIGIGLKDTHLNQARQYATDEGIEWIILTNGDVWKVYRNVLVGNIPRANHVFTVKISDEDMKPAEKTDLLYLMSRESARKHEIANYYDRRVALSGENLADHLLEEDVINKIRLSLKKDSNQKLSNGDVADALIKHLFNPNVITDEHLKTATKIHRKYQ